MIKILAAEYEDNYKIFCIFSDGTKGIYDLNDILFQNETDLTKPLRQLDEFRSFFIQSGALCWKNGLELDPVAIQRELDKKNLLIKVQKAA